jgi:type I restriction enzyme, S subunit
MANLITDNIHIWIAAQATKTNGGKGNGNSAGNQSSYGIKKLRELILELAVRGKLVPQDLNDEPASVLLEKIAQEKARLIKEGKIKKQEPLPEISEAEKLFELPRGWEWVRLGNITNRIGSGSTPSGGRSVYATSGIPFLRSQNIWNHGLELDDVAYITLEIHQNMSNTIVLPNDILLNITGASLGRCAIYPDRMGEANVSQHVTIIRPTDMATRFYLHLCILSPYIQGLVWGRQVGMAREGLSKKVLELFEIPLPPLAEQHRIVAKVDELMALCDRLEQGQADSNATHQALVDTLLATLTTAADQAVFTEAWQRIAEHFDTLFTTENSIDQLKQTILQLAVMGKLVPQDPNNEPASALLERIAEEKARLLKEAKIKKQEPLPEICEDEKPFGLPDGWEWVRLGGITSRITDGDHQTPPRTLEGYRLLSAKNVRDGHLDLDNCDFISEEHYVKSRERCCPEFNDILIVSVGGTIGRTSLIPKDSYFALVRSVALIKPLLIDSSYLKYSMDSRLLQNSIHARKRGGAQPCLYLSEIEKFLFSLPPLAEQHRIVAKVDELMALCDALKARLKDAQTTQVYLADAIVEQAVA